MISFAHQPLKTRAIEDVIGEFFVREHGKGSALSSGDEFGSFLYREVRVLADDRHHHANHNLQAPDLLRFLFRFVALHTFQNFWLPGFPHVFRLLS